MPRIPSANPDSIRLDTPGPSQYLHGVSERRSYIPLAFQVTSPLDVTRVLLPHALVMHVNPKTFSETMTKKVERIQTRGGFVEQHWGDDLGEISADASTGGFVNLRTGLTSVLRKETIAWDRYRDLVDLFKHNGSVYDPYGAVVLQGKVMVIYDRGTYLGHFSTFSTEETDDAPFIFSISWAFKVETVIIQIPVTSTDDKQMSQFISKDSVKNDILVADPANPTGMTADQKKAEEKAADDRLNAANLQPE